MAPKHGLQHIKDEDEQVSKRSKSSATPVSRSATPADAGNMPFSVVYPYMPSTPNDNQKLTKKELGLLPYAEFQKSPFEGKGTPEGALDQHYVVLPPEDWASMKKYSNFIIQGEVYKNNQFVFVRAEDTPNNKNTEGQPKDFWVARILQVRAKNAQHVYALVAWLYWPDELPPPKVKSSDQLKTTSGRRRYHGSHELVASNYMEVLDVLSFAGKADIQQWLEEDDNLTSKLYWRQTYNRSTLELSKLREHCVCNGYFNPEIPMYICDNATCKVWLHDECLIDDVLTRTYKRLVEDDSNGVAKSKKGKATVKRYKGVFKAKISQDGDAPPKVTITDLRPSAPTKSWDESIVCPKCSATLL